jgi:hypothetical protein
VHEGFKFESRQLHIDESVSFALNPNPARRATSVYILFEFSWIKGFGVVEFVV